MSGYSRNLAWYVPERGDPVVFCRNLTWAVNAYGECTVLCVHCRALFAEDVALSVAREITDTTQCNCAKSDEQRP